MCRRGDAEKWAHLESGWEAVPPELGRLLVEQKEREK